jgi:hypothetical protein
MRGYVTIDFINLCDEINIEPQLLTGKNFPYVGIVSTVTLWKATKNNLNEYYLKCVRSIAA